jgi:hypothetical protein
LLTTIVIDAVAVLVPSLAVTVNTVEGMATEGVPAMRPIAEFRTKPAGSAGLTEKVLLVASTSEVSVAVSTIAVPTWPLTV